MCKVPTSQIIIAIDLRTPKIIEKLLFFVDTGILETIGMLV